MRTRTTRRWATTIALVATAAITAACTSGESGTGTADEVVLIAYDSFTPAEGIFDDFTARTGATVKVVTAGDTGTMVSKAILSAGNPEGDVMWGIDNTFLSRAQAAGVLERFEAVDEGDICVNYDKEWFARRGLEVPTGFADLVRPEYKGLLTVQDPVNSSPGLGFLLATIAHHGDDAWQEYWRQLRANDVNVAPDWSSAYYEDFSGSSGDGPYPLVVSYGSSPPAEVVYSETPIEEPPTAVIESTCFRQVEYAGVLRGTKNPDLADQLVDYLLSRTFQESIPLTLFVFPVNPEAVLPEVFEKFAVRPADPLTIPADKIEANRSAWLDSWRGIFS
jgi:thiamine transport system substrate-binding protein